MKQLIVLKLGGGVITDKAKPFTVRQRNMALLAGEVARAYKAHPTAHFLLGTGAGSYGHVTAHEYELSKGAYTSEQLYGMSVTHNSVRHLNSLMADALTGKGVPAFGLSPAALMTAKNETLEHLFIAPIRCLLESRCVPILHGDTITDTSRGTTIFSTENVFNACLAQLREAYDRIIVIYAMNENGVLDTSGKVIPELSAGLTVVANKATGGQDVTGSILGKVQAAREALRFADVVYIVNGTKRGTIQKAIDGTGAGTKVTASL